MKHPEGYIEKGKDEPFYKLKKSFYGMKQSTRMWYQKFNSYILGLGFVRSQVDHCVYYKKVDEYFIYVVFYVNDMLLVRNNMELVKEVKLQIYSKFDMKDLNDTNFSLQMEIKRDRVGSLNL